MRCPICVGSGQKVYPVGDFAEWLACYFCDGTGTVPDIVGEVTQPPQSRNLIELDWIEKNKDSFIGQWVVLDGTTLLAANSDLSEAMKEARRKRAHRRLFVHFISGEEIHPAAWVAARKVRP